MGAAILFQKSYVVSNGKPTLPPAIRRKHWQVWSYYLYEEPGPKIQDYKNVFDLVVYFRFEQQHKILEFFLNAN